MNAVEVIGLVIIALAIGIAIGKACADELLIRQRDAALRHARIAAKTAYRAAVELEVAQSDLYIMDGRR